MRTGGVSRLVAPGARRPQEDPAWRGIEDTFRGEMGGWGIPHTRCTAKMLLLPPLQRDRLEPLTIPSCRARSKCLSELPLMAAAMSLTREDWKRIGRSLLAGAGPSYAKDLRSRAESAPDAETRRKYIEIAALVEDFASDPQGTVDSIEILYDVLFGTPKRKRKSASKRSRKR